MSAVEAKGKVTPHGTGTKSTNLGVPGGLIVSWLLFCCNKQTYASSSEAMYLKDDRELRGRRAATFPGLPELWN